jgi:TRAP-type transport system small permease protein
MSDRVDPAASPATARRIAQVAVTAARTLLGAVLLGMVLLNVANAVCRYLFSVVLIGADELLVYAMIWMVMIGIILVTIERRHIALDFLMNRLSARPRMALALLHSVILTIGCSYATWQCLEFTMRVASVGQTSMALGFPMVFAHAALIVGFAGTALVAALLVVGDAVALAGSPRRHTGQQP